ncbi:glutamate racemase [Collinsella sp. An2]|uniref:glutamate racemase n=1 Tax=Collinsella sp. An2 TaxID=1965585 RepID=UPI000B3739F9|nr:glutamate racemase [Collinsella sp. An2]OUP11026.1 glutamate racemase [Collinsella sp. An2]
MQQQRAEAGFVGPGSLVTPHPSATDPLAAERGGNSRPIGVFDSGLGGLTVARAMARALPHESIYYLGDTKRCPYGPRDEDEVRSFVIQAGRWLEAHDVKIMVIACNTATAAGLHLAQQLLRVPVIGVIAPGARAAINTTRTRKVGVLATELTVRSGAYRRAIHSLDAGVDVYGCPAPSFVEIVERELATGAHLQERWLENGDIFDTPENRAEVCRTLSPLADRDVDTVVLGCTHFPLLAGPIRAALGPGVHVVSSAEETTRELTDILQRREQLASADVEPQHRFATTSDNIAAFAAAGSFIFGQPLRSVEYVGLDELEALDRR